MMLKFFHKTLSYGRDFLKKRTTIDIFKSASKMLSEATYPVAVARFVQQKREEQSIKKILHQCTNCTTIDSLLFGSVLGSLN